MSLPVLCHQHHQPFHRPVRLQSGPTTQMEAANASTMGLEQMLSISMTSASAAMSRDIRMVRVHEAIAGLTEEQKEAIRMRYAEGLPTKEIAEKIGKSDAATRVLLSRIMRQLEKQLEDVKPTR